MAHRKAGGSAKNLRDSNPKYLGIKLTDGQFAQIGSIIVRQRGTKIVAGINVGVGKDHTLFALKEGIVRFGIKRKIHFDGKSIVKKKVSVVSEKIGKKPISNTKTPEKKITKTVEKPKAKTVKVKKDNKSSEKKVVKKTKKKA